MRRWGIVLLLLLAALAVRLAAGYAWQSRLPGRFEFGDSESYWVLARALADRQPYEYADNPAFRMPAYPLLLAPLFLLQGADPPVLWARALTAFYGTLAVAGAAWLGSRLGGRSTAIVAAAIAAFYPGQVALGGLVLSEAPFCAAIAASLALWVIALQTSSPRTRVAAAAATGVVAGVACLIHPSWLLFPPFALTVMAIFKQGRTRWVTIGGTLLLGFVVTLSPWWIRNYWAIGHFVPATLQVGASLYDGLNPHATGGSDMRFVPRFQQALHGTQAEKSENREFTLSEKAETAYTLDKQMETAAMEWAWNHPMRVIQLAEIKFLRFWNIWPNQSHYSAWWIRLLTIFTFVPTLILGIIGALRTVRRGPAYWLCWLPAVYLTLLHLVFVSSIRYREPAMLPLIVLAAALVVGAERNKEHGR